MIFFAFFLIGEGLALAMDPGCEPWVLSEPPLAPLISLLEEQEREAFPGRTEVMSLTGKAPEELLRQRASLHPMNLARHLDRMSRHLSLREEVMGQTEMRERWLNVYVRDREIKAQIEVQALRFSDLSWSEFVLNLPASESWSRLLHDLKDLRRDLESLDLGITIDQRHEIEFAIGRWQRERKLSEEVMSGFLAGHIDADAMTRFAAETSHKDGLPSLHHIVAALGSQLGAALVRLEISKDPEPGPPSPFSGRIALTQSRIQTILMHLVFELVRPYFSVWDYPLMDRDSARTQALAAGLVLTTLPLPEDTMDFFGLLFRGVIDSPVHMGEDLSSVKPIWAHALKNMRELLSKSQLEARHFGSENQAWNDLFARVQELEPLLSGVHGFAPIPNVFVSLASQVLSREWKRSDGFPLGRRLDGLRRLSAAIKLKRIALNFQCNTEMAQCPPSAAHRIRFLVDGFPSGFELLEQTQSEVDYLPRWGSARPSQDGVFHGADFRSDDLLASDQAMVERLHTEFEQGLELYEKLQVSANNGATSSDLMTWLDQMVVVFNSRAVQTLGRPALRVLMESLEKETMSFRQFPLDPLTRDEIANIEALLRMGERIFVMMERLCYHRANLEGRRHLRDAEEYSLLNTGYHVQLLRSVLMMTRLRQ